MSDDRDDWFTRIKVHPAAADFPMLDESELGDLANDIATNGLIIPIVLDATGKILIDGRNRLRACEIAGVEPRFQRLDGEDLDAYVVSANIKRRNLTAQQRAMTAAKAWARAEAEGRVLMSGETARRPSSSKIDKDQIGRAHV